MPPSNELNAMMKLEECFEPLDADEQNRVLAWAQSRFGNNSAVTPETPCELDANSSGLPANKNTLQLSNIPDNLVDIYDLAAPSTDAEKALVVAYWLQELQGKDDVTSQQVNTELKHLGHGIGNVTRAFVALGKQRPTLAMQTRKSGTTKQARKKYRVTNEGIRYVQKLISHTE